MRNREAEFEEIKQRLTDALYNYVNYIVDEALEDALSERD